MAKEDTKQNENTSLVSLDDVLPDKIFVIPLKSRPIYPGILTPLIISKGPFSEIVDKQIEIDSYVALLLMKDDEMDDVRKIDLYTHGTMARVLKKINLPDGGINILINCLRRIKVRKFLSDAPKIVAQVDYVEDFQPFKDIEVKALTRAILSQLKTLSENNPLFTEEMKLTMVNVDEPGRIADFVASILNLEKREYQKLIETTNVKSRLEMVLKLLEKEIQVVEVQRRIQSQINDKIESQQRDFFLHEQLKAIRKELGMDEKDKHSEVRRLREKLESLTLTEEARDRVQEELEKLEYLEPQAGDYAVIRNYLELIAALPWNTSSEDSIDINEAEKILNRDHYGLEDVKKRILEFLAVRILKQDAAGSIICLVGPPGVGKTSLGKSMAKSMGRKFFRVSLGGMRDEAEIKGHRRTYVGAMPGKIIQALKVTQTNNPVIMLDEIDKMGISFQGDPAAALLEVLDPEQNSAFRDNYLDLSFDISRTLFITTANTLDNIPSVLLDRMEIIRIAGYLDQEKYEIMRRYLLPKQLEKHGLDKKDIRISKKTAMHIIDRYARESGLRNLERYVEKICRKKAFHVVQKKDFYKEIQIEHLQELLGSERFSEEKIDKVKAPGLVNGLAWTSYGGAILTIEAMDLKEEKARFQLTGQLGDVMKESANIAYSYARKIMQGARPENPFFDKNSVHLHIPAGATPKDGPSAGITMALSLISLASNMRVPGGIAMTGELTLSGQVLPIGGLKEKILAARRNQIRTVIFPKENEKELQEISADIKGKINFVPVEKFQEVLEVCLPKLEL